MVICKCTYKNYASIDLWNQKQIHIMQDKPTPPSPSYDVYLSKFIDIRQWVEK